MEETQDRGSASEMSGQRYNSYLYLLVNCIVKISRAYGAVNQGPAPYAPVQEALLECSRKLRRDWGMAELKPWQSSLLDSKAWETVLFDLEEIAGIAEMELINLGAGAIWSRDSESYRSFVARFERVMPPGRGCDRWNLSSYLDIESMQMLPGRNTIGEVMNGLLVVIETAQADVQGHLDGLAASYRAVEREGGRSAYRDRPRGEGRYERSDRSESRYGDRGSRYGDRARGDRFARNRYADRRDGPLLDADEARRAMLREQSEAEARFRDRETAPVRKSFADPAPVDGPAPDCPLCGARMELRTIRHGERAGSRFWGCPDFPNCRGTRDASAR